MEPTEKNFKQFEKDNPFLHLNVYTVAAADEKCPITPLYMGMNRSNKIANILYYKNEQTSHYTTLRKLVGSSTMQQRATRGSLSVRTAPVPSSTLRKHSGTTWKRNTPTSITSLCVRNVSLSSILRKLKNSMTASAWSRKTSRVWLNTQHMTNPSAGKRGTTTC